MRQLVPPLRQLELAIWSGALLGLAAAASAQPADTLDWKRYYPLEVGNVWEYHGAEISDQITRYTLVADTVANGRTYYRRQLDFALIHYPQAGADTARSTSVDFLRYDEGGVVAVASVEADTVALDPCSDEGFERDLRLAFGTTRPCPPPLLQPEADSVHVEGSYAMMWAPPAIRQNPAFDPVEVAAIKLTTVGATFSTFVADVGPVSTGNLWGPRLHYARIGGVEYGAPSALVNAPPPPPARANLRPRPRKPGARPSSVCPDAPASPTGALDSDRCARAHCDVLFPRPHPLDDFCIHPRAGGRHVSVCDLRGGISSKRILHGRPIAATARFGVCHIRAGEDAPRQPGDRA